MAKQPKDPEAPAEGAAPPVQWPEDRRNPITKEMGLYQKIAYVMAHADRVPKSGYNDHHRYHYVTESDLTDHLRPLMAEAGLILLYDLLEDERRGEITTARIEYTIVDVDSGQKHTFRLKADGQDRQDKGFYKAYTGGNKYALLKTFQISTGDDPEQATEHDRREAQRRGGGNAPRQGQQRQGGNRRQQEQRQPPPQQQAQIQDRAGGNPTPTQLASREAARARQEGDVTPATDETLELLDLAMQNQKIPEDKRRDAQEYIAKKEEAQGFLYERQARGLINGLEALMTPAEKGE